METSSSFFSKILTKNNANQIKVQKKKQQFCFLHDLIVDPRPYRSVDYDKQNNENDNEKDYFTFHNPKTDFYRCRKFQHSVEFQKLPIYLIKRIAYRKQNIKDDQGRIIYNDDETKSYDQVATQFHCLELLKGSHRSIQLIEVLHQNTKFKQDKKFFYQDLNLQDRRSQSIRNICFVLEEMNGGSLYELIMKETQFSEQQIVEYSCQIAQGLLELQSKGIIHRDLRPENILFHNGQIKFADYDAAFIKGYSDYRNIKNGVDMKDTTPQEIMMLVAQSQDNLKNLTNEKLFEMQERADVYFLGVSLYCMIFSQFFQSFNHRYLKVITNNKRRMGFCPKILDVMERCLQKNPHHRIELKEVIDNLAKLQRQFYLKSSQYRRVYLSPQPLNLYSFSSNQIQQKIKSQSTYAKVYCKYNREEMEKNIFQAIKYATLQRKTSFYSKLFYNLIQGSSSYIIWKQNPKSKLVRSQRFCLFQKIQKFLERLQIKAYYYQFAYRILCEVNLANIKQPIYFQNIRLHIQLFSSELVVILTFIYETMMKRSYTTDPSYQQTNIGYENKRIVDNIRILHSRWQFFSGRLRLQKEANNRVKLIKKRLKEFSETEQLNENDVKQAEQLQQKYRLQFQCMEHVQSLEQMIAKYKSIPYVNQEERLSFAHQQKTLFKLLQRIEMNIKHEMIQTIINLIIAYEKIKMETWGYQSNLKNAIFMLMILDAQNTETVQKNDLVIIKEHLITMININLGWRSEELEAFFTNYTQTHTLQVVRGLQELQSCALIQSEGGSESELNIQINILKEGQGGQTEKDSQKDANVAVPKSSQIIPSNQQERKDKFIVVKELVQQQNLDDGGVKKESTLKKQRERETVEYQLFDSVTQSFQEEEKQKIKGFLKNDIALQIQE